MGGYRVCAGGVEVGGGGLEVGEGGRSSSGCLHLPVPLHFLNIFLMNSSVDSYGCSVPSQC